MRSDQAVVQATTASAVLDASCRVAQPTWAASKVATKPTLRPLPMASRTCCNLQLSDPDVDRGGARWKPPNFNAGMRTLLWRGCTETG